MIYVIKGIFFKLIIKYLNLKKNAKIIIYINIK